MIKGLALALTLAAMTVGGPTFATEMRFAHFSATENDPNHRAAMAFADAVRERTGGEYNITVVPNSQLGGEVDVVEGILLGTIDLAPPSAAVLANWVPEMNVLNMPFAFRDWDHYMSVLNGPIFDEMSKAAAAKGIRLLGFMTSGPRHIMSVMPVNSMDDLKGRKIRTVQNPVHVATFSAFGANATAIAYPEVYAALQTGVVDGGDAANTNYYTAKFYEVAPHWALVSWLYYSNGIIMAEDKFQALSPETQKVFLEVGKEVGLAQQADWRKSDGELLDVLKKEGVQVTEPDRQPFIDAAKKVHAEFITDPEQQRLLDMIMK